MRPNIDFTPFRQATIGFDRLFELLESSIGPHSGDNYPPFDLVQEDDDRYLIRLAVAGFRPDEVEVTAHQNLLTVSGRKKREDEDRYIHRGIAARAFERRFALADYVQVKHADLEDGILSISLAREIPEEMKPRRIEIGSGEGVRQIENASGERQKTNEETKREEKELEPA